MLINMCARFVPAFCALFLTVPAFAVDVRGSIAFTREEVARHQSHLAKVLPTAADCLKYTLNRHVAFYRRYGFSPYYGSATKFAQLSSQEKISHIDSLTRWNSWQVARILDREGEMQSISCVGFVMRCLGDGFKAAGDGDIWRKIATFVSAENDGDGSALQYALRGLGWKSLYWNPDTRLNETWDQDELKLTDKAWRGYHVMRYNQVIRKSKYYTVPIDDAQTLVNFGQRSPAYLSRIPFWIGTAHAGYHVFGGAGSRVIEAHSSRSIVDPETVESSDFNPLRPTGNGPNGIYRSGALVVPPGY